MKVGNKRWKAFAPQGLMIGSSASDKLGFFGKAARSRTAAYTITNLTKDRAIDCNSTTDGEMADMIGTLISDLIDLGIFQGTVTLA
jgi:hypothetical protein